MSRAYAQFLIVSSKVMNAIDILQYSLETSCCLHFLHIHSHFSRNVFAVVVVAVERMEIQSECVSNRYVPHKYICDIRSVLVLLLFLCFCVCMQRNAAEWHFKKGEKCLKWRDNLTTFGLDILTRVRVMSVSRSMHILLYIWLMMWHFISNSYEEQTFLLDFIMFGYGCLLVPLLAA